MDAYCVAVRELEGKFDGNKLHHVKRTDNVAADNLAHLGATREPVSADTFLEILHKPSVPIQEVTEHNPVSDDPEPANGEDEAGTEEPVEKAHGDPNLDSATARIPHQWGSPGGQK